MFVLKRRFLLCVALAFGLVLTTAPAHAMKGAPPGNNGTVKIDGTPFDASPGAPNRNEPHVPCDFRIEFYNYEQDSTWNVTFEAWSPTGDHSADEVVVEVGRANDGTFHPMDLNDDPAEGGDADGIDHREDYRLSFPGLEPHPQQGYHVKATALVDDPDPRGAERKHKVFWVEPCDVAAGSVEQDEKGEKQEVAEGAQERDVTPKPEVARAADAAPTAVTPAATQTEVLGVAIERQAPAAPRAGLYLARTGVAGAGALAPLGAALVVAGALLQFIARPRRRPVA